MARKPWWSTRLEKLKQNPITTPKRKTNRDIYEEELKKLEKLQARATKYGIQDSYKPLTAKRIRQEQIKSIQSHGLSLKREIQKAQTRERNERRRQQRDEEAVERREQRKGETAKRKALEKQAKEVEKKRLSAKRKRARMDRANAKAREKRAQARLLKELQEKFSVQEQEQPAEPDIFSQEQEQPAETEVFAWGDLADFRFHYILSEIDSAIDVLQRSRRYSEYPIEELRDLLVEWYQEDPAEMLTKLFASDAMQQLQTKDQLYSAVETGEIYALMERLTSEHDRLRQIHVEEDFGVLED